MVTVLILWVRAQWGWLISAHVVLVGIEGSSLTSFMHLVSQLGRFLRVGLVGGDGSLSSVMLAGLTSISETPFSSGDVSPTGLFLHVASPDSFT